MKASVFQTILLAVFGASAVAGILIFAFVMGGSNNTGIGQVVIWGTVNETSMNALLRYLSDQDGRFKGVSYVVKNADTYEQELTDALAEGRGPDLFLLSADRALRNAGKTTPIPYENMPRDEFKNTFVESAEPYLSGSGVLAVPIAVDPMIMYWNRDMLSAAGYAQPPKHWEEFYTFSEKVTKRSPANSIEKSAVALGEFENVNHAKDILAMLIQQAGGSIVSTDSAGKFVPALVNRTGTASQAAESALRFYTEFANPAKADYSWNRALPEARAAFAAGDLALYFGFASEAEVIRRMNPNLNFSAAAMPQPRVFDRAVTGGKTYGLALSRTSANAQGALTAAFLLADKTTANAISTALGMPSARRDALSQAPSEGGSNLFNTQAIIVRSWYDPDPEKTATIFRDMIQDVTSGALRITEAVQRADQALGIILNQGL